MDRVQQKEPKMKPAKNNGEKRMKELGLFSLEKEERLGGGDWLTVKYLKGSYQVDKDRLFSVPVRDSTKTNGLRLQQRKLLRRIFSL